MYFIPMCMYFIKHYMSGDLRKTKIEHLFQRHGNVLTIDALILRYFTPIYGSLPNKEMQ